MLETLGCQAVLPDEPADLDHCVALYHQLGEKFRGTMVAYRLVDAVVQKQRPGKSGQPDASVDDTDGGEPGPGGSGGPSRGGHSSASASGVKRPGPSAGEASRQKRPRKPGQAGANVEDVHHGGKSLDCDVAKMEHQLQTALAQEDYAGAAQVQAEMKEARAEMKEVRSQHGDAACALEERRQAEKAARTRLEADLAEMDHQLQTAVAQEDYAGAAQVQAEMKEVRLQIFCAAVRGDQS